MHRKSLCPLLSLNHTVDSGSPEICGERKKFIPLHQGIGVMVLSIIVKCVERFVMYGINNSYSR